MERVIIHVDMDAFFASVEEHDRPELAGRPLVVGGDPDERGVVAAANYAARRFGIHSAMPSATAKRLCPHVLLLRPRHGRYAEVSQQIHAIFERYTPLVEPLSLDEAFLDVTASQRLFGDPATIARRIKETIRCELGLVASVGVAPNKFLAKLASDVDKPDGFVHVRPEGIGAFLDPLPITRLWGVGRVSARVFERLGIETIGQLRHYSPALLRQHFGNASDALRLLADGIDDRPVESAREAKSISHETTFARDIDDRLLLRAWLFELTEQVASRLRRYGLKARTVQLKVRFADFRTITRSRTLDAPCDATASFWSVVCDLFDHHLEHRLPPVRLIGMGVSQFDHRGATQQSLFGEDVHHSQLDGVVDDVNARFGQHTLQRGTSLRTRGR